MEALMVAVIVLVGTQVWLSFRQRKYFLIGKLEEFWLAIEELTSERALLHGPEYTLEDHLRFFGDMSRSMHIGLCKPRMLCSLYFKEAIPHFAAFSEACRALQFEYAKVGYDATQHKDSPAQALYNEVAVKTCALHEFLLLEYKALIGSPVAQWHFAFREHSDLRR